MTPTTTEQTPRAEAIVATSHVCVIEGGHRPFTFGTTSGAVSTARAINSAIADARADERRKVIEEAAQACRDELVDADSTGEQSDYVYNRAFDYVYNRACNDCIDAIRSLLPQQEKQT